MPPQNSNKVLLLKILLHAGFFVSGISTVIIGQLLPILTAKLSINDNQAGYFFLAQFAGSIFGTLSANQFGKRGKFIFTSALGCLLMGIGIAVLNFNSFGICLLGFAVNGIGVGLTLPSINMLIIELNPKRSASALSVLNFFWGVGAICSQPFVDFFSRGTDILIPTLILTIFFFVTGIAIFMQPKEIEQKTLLFGDVTEDFSTPIWKNPLAWAIALFNFIQVGFESAMGGWLKTYTQRIEETAIENWFPPIFMYFVFFVVGRGVAPIFFRYLDENKMLLLSLIIILLGMIILLSAENILFLSIGASVAGFGTSSIFPTNISRFMKTFGASASRRATPLFISGTLGAAFTTWFIGFLSNLYGGNLRVGMLVLLASIIFLIILQTFLTFRKMSRSVN
jgi:MFS transporter, FHS family, glucose/mannose:H+ symporter